MILERLSFLLLITILSCHSKRPRSLLGKWHLDSVSTARGNVVHDSNLSRIITFSGDGSFTYEQMKSDFGFKSKGNYFVNKNVSRNTKTITLLFDLESRDSVTIRQSMNLDILEINHKQFKLVDETKFLDRDGKVMLYNPISFYKKI
jgi:hypothetical protein